MIYAIFIKNIYQFIVITFAFSFTVFSFSQNKLKTTFTSTEIKDFVIEVFQNEANELVFNSNSKRLQLITVFLNRQFSIAYHPQYSGKKFKQLSGLGINNKYNKNLSIDQSYNPRTFNPLKYKFPLSSKSKEMYRIGRTDYIITINTLN